MLDTNNKKFEDDCIQLSTWYNVYKNGQFFHTLSSSFNANDRAHRNVEGYALHYSFV